MSTPLARLGVSSHPFGDLEDLTRLGIRAKTCWEVDAWCGLGEYAALLQSWMANVSRFTPGLYARQTEHKEGWVYLQAGFD